MFPPIELEVYCGGRVKFGRRLALMHDFLLAVRDFLRSILASEGPPSLALLAVFMQPKVQELLQWDLFIADAALVVEATLAVTVPDAASVCVSGRLLSGADVDRRKCPAPLSVPRVVCSVLSCALGLSQPPCAVLSHVPSSVAVSVGRGRRGSGGHARLLRGL